MSSTPSPAATENPPSLAYRDTEGRVGHRLGTGAVALIVGLVILIVAVVTAAIVLPASGDKPEPPQPGPPGRIVSAPAAEGNQAPTPADVPANTPATPPASPGGDGFSPKREPLDLTRGISLTPADGWTVEMHVVEEASHGFAWLTYGNGAEFTVLVQKAESTDIEKVLDNHIAAATDPELTVVSNVVLTEEVSYDLESDNFQKGMTRSFTADVVELMGTDSIVGVFIAFVNTSNNTAALIVAHAPNEDALFDAATDIERMLDSLLEVGDYAPPHGG